MGEGIAVGSGGPEKTRPWDKQRCDLGNDVTAASKRRLRDQDVRNEEDRSAHRQAGARISAPERRPHKALGQQG